MPATTFDTPIEEIEMPFSILDTDLYKVGPDDSSRITHETVSSGSTLFSIGPPRQLS